MIFFREKLKDMMGEEFIILLSLGDEFRARITEVNADYITLHLPRINDGKPYTEVMIVPIEKVVRIGKTFEGKF